MKRKLNMGMVGGGPGSLIGKVHYRAATLDGQIDLACGAFSSDPDKSGQTGREYFLPPDRIYASWEEMIGREKELPEGRRMDFLCIATPNHLHFSQAKIALENGFHVVCDKPLAHSVEQARELYHLVKKSGLVFALTHPYTAYPMVKEAHWRVSRKELGEIRKVVVEYPQGWLSTPLEKSGHKQASWRTDPERSGMGGALADIGVHALQLAEYVTGLKVTGVMADLSTVVPGRSLDDDGNLLLRFSNGAKGLMFATQVAAGEENDVNIRVWGEKGGLEWHHHDPNRMLWKLDGQALQVLRPGHPEYLSPLAMHHTRLPAGHPEGLTEAFANIYKSVAACIREQEGGEQAPDWYRDFPGVEDGLRGMLFQEAAVLSSQEQKWINIADF